MTLRLLLASCLWLTLGKASSHGNSTPTAAPSALEPYCLPVCEGVFPAGSAVPSVTMIFGGMTLTATPAMLSSGGIASAIASASEPTKGSDGIGGVGSAGGNGSIGAGNGSTSTGNGSTSTGNGSTSTGNGSTSTGNGSTSIGNGSTGIGNGSTGIGIGNSSNVSGIQTEPVPSPVPVSANDTAFPGGSSSPEASSSAVGAATDPPTGGEGGLASGSGVPVVSGGVAADASVTNAPQSPQSLAAPPAPAATPSSSASDAAASLSPPAVDALQLAEFLMNLNGAVLPSLPAELATDLITQERTQLDAVQELLGRAGGEAVPACEYIVPSNATELLELAAALKAVELGVFMSLVESLPPADTLASTLLSSMASVAAKQNALLRARSVGAEPFDTPASAAWAYNLALGYARPGSCPVELPLPMLPSLVVNGGKVAHARPDTNVTFGWDAAGGAAAWRSGKPLSVGWVNGVDPPVYTVLTVLGDGTGQSGVPPGLSGTAFAVVTAQPGLDSIGELTAATLAGPVVVGLAL